MLLLLAYCTDALYNLGVAYRYGEGVIADRARAQRYFQYAAEGGTTVVCATLWRSYKAKIKWITWWPATLRHGGLLPCVA